MVRQPLIDALEQMERSVLAAFHRRRPFQPEPDSINETLVPSTSTIQNRNDRLDATTTDLIGKDQVQPVREAPTVFLDIWNWLKAQLRL